MSVDRANRLAEHARARHEQTLHRAQAALTSMANNGEAITVSLLAGKAGVSRSWIYTQPELRDYIEQLQQATTRTGAPRRETTNHASEESLRRRLTLAHQRITQLRTENQQLRESLAHAHGQLRAARDTAGSAITTGKEPRDDRA
jgi:predicted  nucleic acid-binding Zn-ribbon protein